MQALPFIVAGAFAGKAYEEHEAMKAQQGALELKRKQQEAIASQEQIQRDDALMRVQGEQLAQATAQGMALSSGTLGSLQLGSYNKFAKSSQVGKFNLEMTELSLDQQRSALESQYWANVFGSVEKLAMQGYSMSGGGGSTGLQAGPNFGLDTKDGADFWGNQQTMLGEESRPNLVERYENRGRYAQWLYENGE